MLPVLAFAFVAGVLTILAPCTLPVVPLVLGTAATRGRRRTPGLLLGFGFSFVAVTVVLASALAAAGLTAGTLRVASALLLAAVGLSLALPRLSDWLARQLAPISRLGTRLVGQRRDAGLVGGLILGGAIGLVWAPCVGPIMAAVIAVAATRGPSSETVLIALVYVAGAAVPIGLIAGWGRRATRSLQEVSGPGRLQRVFGLAMLLSALLVASGLDLTVENGVVGLLPPGWTGALTSVEQQPAIQTELDTLEVNRLDPQRAGPTSGTQPPGSAAPPNLPAPLASSLPSNVALENLGTAPELTGIAAWINSKPLTVAALRGKVILVEFWTFGCINCSHVQPFVKAWYDRYAAAGLVVSGSTRRSSRSSATWATSAMPWPRPACVIRSPSIRTLPPGLPTATTTGPPSTSSTGPASFAMCTSAKATMTAPSRCSGSSWVSPAEASMDYDRVPGPLH